MSTISKTLSKATLFVAGFSALATTAMAQSSASADAAGGFIGLMMIGVWCCAGIFGLAAVAFNIWMIVDVLQRTEATMPNRTMWMILLIVGLFVGFGFIAALVYYFTEKKKLDGGK